MNNCSFSKCANALLKAPAITLLITGSSVAMANTPAPKLYGFINQGIVKTTDNSFFGDSEDYSLRFTSAAIGANWRPLPKVQLSAQATYMQAGETTRDDVFVDYALVDLTVAQGMTWQTGIRAGRIKNPYGFYNETRDVASTRPSIILPESIYRNSLRDLVHTSDSLSLYANAYLGDHFIQLDLMSGDAIFSDATEKEFVGPRVSGSVEDEEIDIARIMVESFGGKLRLAYTYTEIRNDFDPEPGSFAGKSTLEMDVYSAEFNWEKWRLTAEYQDFDLKSQGIFFPGIKSSRATNGYYVSAAYQMNHKWEIFLRHDVLYRDSDDKDGKSFEARTGLPAHNIYSNDITLGVRYHHDKHWLFAAEIHDIKGTGAVSINENDLRDTEKDWNMFTAQVSYQF